MLRIFHTADIQIEVRNSSPRYDEYLYMLNQLVEKANGHDIAVLDGDLTEYATPNEVERQLLVGFVSKLKTSVKEIVIIKGNHDLIQRQSQNTYIENGIKKNVPAALDILFGNMNDEQIVYCPISGIYASKNFNLNYVVWGQQHKYEIVPTHSYNPLEEFEIDENVPAITLFHDCIKNAKNFDGHSVRGSENKPDFKFNTKLVLAGDIHCPSIAKIDDTILTYCSSPIQRDYGEGDYYLNGRLFQNGTSKHGFNSVSYNDDDTFDIEFKQLEQYHNFQTLIFDSKFDIDEFRNFYHPDEAKQNSIKIRIKEDYDKILNQLEQIIAIIKTRNNNCEFRIESGKDLQSDVIVGDSIDVDSLISIDKIKEIAADFVSKKVGTSRSIPKEDKEAVQRDIVNIFNQELDFFEKSNRNLNVIPLSLDLSNFMALGDDVHVDFNNGITKISGSNGTGKSTLYNAIKWLWTDYVYLSQKSNYKKENALMLFNNKRPNVDTVYGKIVQLVNGSELTIQKSIERIWKKDTTTENKISENWMEFCDMPSIEYVVEWNDKRYTGTEAIDVLYSIFGGLSNIQRTLFATAPSLFNIINTSTSELNDEILYNLGLNFFEQMYDRYDTLRSQTLDNLAKPSQSVSELNELIKEQESKQVKLENLKQENIKKLDESLTKQDIVKQRIDDIKATKYNVSTDDIDKLMTSLSDNDVKINDIQREIDKQNISISEISKKYENNDVEHNLDLLHASIEQLSSKQNDIYSKKIDFEKDVIRLENNYNSRIAEIQSTVKDKVIELNEKLIESKTLAEQVDKSIADKNHEQEIFLMKFDSSIQQGTSEKNQRKSELTNLNTSLENKKQLIIEQVNQMKSEKICPHCGRKHTDESFAFAFKNIENLETEIKSIDIQIDTNTKQLNDIDKKFEQQLEQANLKKNEAIRLHTVAITKLNEQKSTILSNISKLQETKASLKTNMIEAINSDMVLNDIASNKNTIIKEIDKYAALLGNIESELKDAKTKLELYNDMKKEFESIPNIQALLNANKNQMKLLTDFKKQITEQIVINKEQLEKNKQIDAKISEITETELKPLVDTISNITDTSNELDTEMALSKSKVNEYQSLVHDAIQYRIKDSSMRIYKQIIGKNGLPTYIFDLIRPNLNESLNEMLNGLGFVLQFNESNELKMIKLDDNMQIKQSVAFSSGMESTFLGLSLLYVLKTKNISKKLSILFIDEVTGALNDGSDLSYQAKNYQELFKQLLHKMKTSFNIFIIDHVIKNLDEDVRYEVIPTNDGSQIERIK